jgi:predicted RNA binding protein YcfA (HicA-like mRNA interferase family)
MGSLSIVSGRKLVKILEKFGWVEIRRNSGHIIMIKTAEIITLSIPDHKELAKGTLRSLLRSAEITINEYNKVINK